MPSISTDLGIGIALQNQSQVFDPRGVPNIFMHFSGNDPSYMKKLVAGTGTVSALNDDVHYWVDQVGGIIAKGAAADAGGGKYKPSAVGHRGAVSIPAGQNGLIADVTRSLASGCTVITLAVLDDISLGFRTLYGVGPDGSTSPFDTADGFQVNNTDSANLFAQRQNAGVTAGVSTGTVYMFVDIWDHTTTGPINVPGFVDSGQTGIHQFWENGGIPVGESFYSDVTSIDITKLFLGGNTSRFSNSIRFLEQSWISGPVTPIWLQRYKSYFESILERNITLVDFRVLRDYADWLPTGLCVNCGYYMPVMADMLALGVNGYRIDLTGGAPQDAALDALIRAIYGAGKKIMWLCPSLPISGGAYYSPDTYLRQICTRMAACGYGDYPALIEPGNENIQLNVGSFADEAAALTAYVTMCRALKQNNTGYNWKLLCGSDELAYEYKIFKEYRAQNAPRAEWPDAFSRHSYSDGHTDANTSNVNTGVHHAGNTQWARKVLCTPVVDTEGQKLTSPNAISSADCVTWLSTILSALRAGENVTHYTLVDTSFDASTNGYAFYNTIGTAVNGLSPVSGRTVTLTNLATALGKTLP